VDVKVPNVNICFYEENFGLMCCQGFERMVALGLSTAILDEPRGPRRLIMVRLPIVSRTFPLDACPPNFTPVEDPTFSSFSPGAYWDFLWHKEFDLPAVSRGRRAFAGSFRGGISGRQALPRL